MASPAYTIEEKELVQQLVGNYPIIVDKKTDATSIRRKNEAWGKLCHQYNSDSSGVKRSVVQLKRCWDKLKRQRKCELAKRKYLLNTGGEPQPFVAVIDSVMPQPRFEIPTKFDSDASLGQIADEDFNVLPPSPAAPVTTQVSYTPLQSASLSKGKPKSRQNGIDQLMDTRNQNAMLEKVQLQEIHAVRLQVETIRRDTALVELEIAQEKLKQERLKTRELEAQQGIL